MNSSTPSSPRGQPRPARLVLVENCRSTNSAIHRSSIGGLLCARHVREPGNTCRITNQVDVCIFNPGNVLTVIDRLTDYILTWLRLLQLLRAPEDELVDAEVLAVDPGAALARLVLVQEPEVPALVLHVTSSCFVTRGLTCAPCCTCSRATRVPTAAPSPRSP